MRRYCEKHGERGKKKRITETPRWDGTFKNKISGMLVHKHKSDGNSWEFCHDHWWVQTYAVTSE